MHILLALIIGWFFAVSSPYGERPNAFIRSIVGPFDAEIECNLALTQTKAMFEEVGALAVFTPCQDRQGI